MTLRIFLLILASVTISAFAQISLKRGVSGETVQSALNDGDLMQKLLAVAGSPMIFFGLFLYGLGAMVWILVLAKIDVSQAYPFVGMGFVLTLVFGAFLLGETVGPMRIAGTVLIGVGILFLSRS